MTCHFINLFLAHVLVWNKSEGDGELCSTQSLRDVGSLCLVAERCLGPQSVSLSSQHPAGRWKKGTYGGRHGGFRGQGYKGSNHCLHSIGQSWSCSLIERQAGKCRPAVYSGRRGLGLVGVWPVCHTATVLRMRIAKLSSLLMATEWVSWSVLSRFNTLELSSVGNYTLSHSLHHAWNSIFSIQNLCVF